VKFKDHEEYVKWKADKIKAKETGKEVANSRHVFMAKVLQVKRWILKVWQLMIKE
jgi:hypothetical protein